MIVLNRFWAQISPRIHQEKVPIPKCSNFRFVSAGSWKLPFKNLASTFRGVVTMNLGLAKQQSKIYHLDHGRIPLLCTSFYHTSFSNGFNMFSSKDPVVIRVCTRSPWTPAAADVSHCGEKQGHSLHQWLLEWLDKPPHSIDLEPLPAWREICPPDRQDIVKSQAHASLKHSSCNPCQPILQLGLERQDLKALLLEANAWHLPGQIH